jgi:hypothetical protein
MDKQTNREIKLVSPEFKIVFDEKAEEVGESGSFRFWKSSLSGDDTFLYTPAIGVRKIFEGFEDLNFAVVKISGKYTVFNVETGRALVSDSGVKKNAIEKVEKLLSEKPDYFRLKINEIIERYGVLPTLEPKPRVKVDENLKRVGARWKKAVIAALENNEQLIALEKREILRKQDALEKASGELAHEESSDRFLIDNLKRGIEESEGKITLLEKARKIIDRLKSESVWVYNQLSKTFDLKPALAFEEEGLSLAVIKSPYNARQYVVCELTTGLGIANRVDNINWAITDFLSQVKMRGGDVLRQYVENWLSSNPRSPYYR